MFAVFRACSSRVGPNNFSASTDVSFRSSDISRSTGLVCKSFERSLYTLGACIDGHPRCPYRPCRESGVILINEGALDIPLQAEFNLTITVKLHRPVGLCGLQSRTLLSCQFECPMPVVAGTVNNILIPPPPRYYTFYAFAYIPLWDVTCTLADLPASHQTDPVVIHWFDPSARIAGKAVCVRDMSTTSTPCLGQYDPGRAGQVPSLPHPIRGSGGFTPQRPRTRSRLL